MKIPSNIKAVIFDLDGLLIDSEPSWAEADKILLGKRGYVPTEEIFLKRLGTGIKQTIEIYKEEFGLTEDTQSLIDERLILFFEILEKNLALMTGARELIAELYSANMKLAIASSGPYENNIDGIVNKLEIKKHFSVILTGEDAKNAKPAPDIFYLAVERLGISSRESLVLEDAPNGVIAGKAAGMTVYGVNKDKNIAKELKKAGADEVFDSLSEITL